MKSPQVQPSPYHEEGLLDVLLDYDYKNIHKSIVKRGFCLKPEAGSDVSSGGFPFHVWFFDTNI